MNNPDKKKRSAYLIGVKGVGMTALAQLLKAQGYNVSGSDTGEMFFTDAVLKRHGILVYEGFDAKRAGALAKSCLVVASSAHGDKNPEVREFKRRDFKIHSYAEALGEIFKKKHGISVCGSHGKTTASALLAFVFQQAGLKPSAVIGSEVMQYKGNALSGSGKHFIAETDEYQNKLRYFDPKAVLLLNVDYDHPDFFSSPAAYRRVFRDYIARIPAKGILVACGDDAEVLRILSATRADVIAYGFDPPPLPLKQVSCTWLARNARAEKGFWRFDAYKNNVKFGSFKLRIVGRHNVLNALGVVAMADGFGISRRHIAQSLKEFRGTRRRFEHVGTYRGALLIDDYAHHPAEIRATLAAARELYGKRRIIAVFHPHTFSRTKALFGDFSKAFGNADEVLVLDIYGSAREKRGGVASAGLVKNAKKFHKHVRLVRTIPKVVEHLRSHVRRHDVVLLLGAGDVWKVAAGLIKTQ